MGWVKGGCIISFFFFLFFLKKSLKSFLKDFDLLIFKIYFDNYFKLKCHVFLFDLLFCHIMCMCITRTFSFDWVSEKCSIGIYLLRLKCLIGNNVKVFKWIIRTILRGHTWLKPIFFCATWDLKRYVMWLDCWSQLTTSVSSKDFFFLFFLIITVSWSAYAPLLIPWIPDACQAPTSWPAEVPSLGSLSHIFPGQWTQCVNLFPLTINHHQSNITSIVELRA